MKIRIIIYLVFLILFTGCTPNANNKPAKTEDELYTKIVTTPGLGGIVGQIKIPKFWEQSLLYAYAAPYLGDPEGEGIFILDDKLNAFSEINRNGKFLINNIPPGIYILVIGPDTETAIPYRENGLALKYEVFSDQFLDVGLINFDN